MNKESYTIYELNDDARKFVINTYRTLLIQITPNLPFIDDLRKNGIYITFGFNQLFCEVGTDDLSNLVTRMTDPEQSNYRLVAIGSSLKSFVNSPIEFKQQLAYLISVNLKSIVSLLKPIVSIELYLERNDARFDKDGNLVSGNVPFTIPI